MIWPDDDELPAHERCGACGDWVCPSDEPFACVASDGCMQEGNTASASLWTAYEILVHARCVPAFEKELEDDHYGARADDSWKLHA
jgi:hypothetical protein